MPCDGPIDVQFVYSRDGINWQHADRERTAVIPRGDGGSFDRGMIIGTAKEPIVEGDEIHWYYTGGEHTHGGQMEKRVKRLGRATWQRDRFVALSAGGSGSVTTRSLIPPEGAVDLEINTDASQGRIRVELCNENGTVVDGFSGDGCVPLTADDLHWRVRWKTGHKVDPEKPVKIRFILEKARIYSFTFRGESE